MANQQTRALRRFNCSTKVGKGVNFKDNDGFRAVKNEALTFQEFASTKGRAVDSKKERVAHLTPGGKERKAWKGCGDPLGRNR